MLGYATFRFLPFWQLRPSLGSSAFAYSEGGANQTLLDTQVFKIAGEFLPGSNELYAALEELRGLSTTLKSS